MGWWSIVMQMQAKFHSNCFDRWTIRHHHGYHGFLAVMPSQYGTGARISLWSREPCQQRILLMRKVVLSSHLHSKSCHCSLWLFPGCLLEYYFQKKSLVYQENIVFLSAAKLKAAQILPFHGSLLIFYQEKDSYIFCFRVLTLIGKFSGHELDRIIGKLQRWSHSWNSYAWVFQKSVSLNFGEVFRD